MSARLRIACIDEFFLSAVSVCLPVFQPVSVSSIHFTEHSRQPPRRLAGEYQPNCQKMTNKGNHRSGCLAGAQTNETTHLGHCSNRPNPTDARGSTQCDTDIVRRLPDILLIGSGKYLGGDRTMGVGTGGNPTSTHIYNMYIYIERETERQTDRQTDRDREKQRKRE